VSVFSIATHDPASAETGVIAGRVFYARKFSIKEVQAVAQAVTKALQEATVEEPFTVKHEIKAIVRPLNARLADDGKPVTVDDLLDALTEEDYRAVLAHYAPSLLAAVSVEGKA
jgi:hypothetical protein